MPYAFLPDTSVLTNGKALKLIQDGTLNNYQPTERIQPLEGESLEIVLSRVVLAEIENKANHTKAGGSGNIQVIEDLYQLSKKKTITIRVVGQRPSLEQIRLNASGELDAAIRRDAQQTSAILITGDHVQATMALIEGIEVLFIQNTIEGEINVDGKKILRIQDFFDDNTMSIHLRAHCVPKAKRGKPGDWELINIGDKELDTAEVTQIATRIMTEAKTDEYSFIERDEPGVSVIQLRNYRIVVCRPPFSNAVEITAVRPLVELTLTDYDLPKKVYERLDVAEGVLVAGKPGAGKSTFISALVKFYLAKNKIVKTLESVRDLIVPNEVSQYAPLEGNLEKTADILLLVRPDFTIFDEVRVEDDFKTFGDMRLAGVGMVGVVHASRAVDAIQRFIRRVELGIIPNVIDTVIFINKGQVAEILSLNLTVKKPTGFKDEDLSRPVIEVRDFLRGDLLYEIYNFGQDAVVNKVGDTRGGYNTSSRKPDRGNKRDRRRGRDRSPVYEEVLKNDYDDDATGDYDDGASKFKRDETTLTVEIFHKPKGVILSVGQPYGNANLNFYADEELIFSATLSRQGDVNIKKTSPIYTRIMTVLNDNRNFYASFQ